MTQHRIFLVRPLGEPPHRPQREHWEQHHGDLFSSLEGLGGYRQNRPLACEWESGAGWFCSETWFPDREQEARSYASEFYRTDVTRDEASFLHRDAAWQSPVLGSDDEPDGLEGWRVLWFGAAPPTGPTWHRLLLARSAPGVSEPELHSAWFDSEDEALAAARFRRPGVISFACRPHTFLPRASREKA